MCDHEDTHRRALERKIDRLLWENDRLRWRLEEKEEGNDD